jgi:hypothetical protein
MIGVGILAGAAEISGARRQILQSSFEHHVLTTEWAECDALILQVTLAGVSRA